jgi:hypothetical protein
MTIEQLIACDANTLEKMSNDELKIHFAQYFPETRPDMATPAIRKEQQIMSANPKLAAASALAKSLGIEMDIGLLTLRRKK